MDDDEYVDATDTGAVEHSDDDDDQGDHQQDDDESSGEDEINPFPNNARLQAAFKIFMKNSILHEMRKSLWTNKKYLPPKLNQFEDGPAAFIRGDKYTQYATTMCVFMIAQNKQYDGVTRYLINRVPVINNDGTWKKWCYELPWSIPVFTEREVANCSKSMTVHGERVLNPEPNWLPIAIKQLAQYKIIPSKVDVVYHHQPCAYAVGGYEPPIEPHPGYGIDYKHSSTSPLDREQRFPRRYDVNIVFVEEVTSDLNSVSRRNGESIGQYEVQTDWMTFDGVVATCHSYLDDDNDNVQYEPRFHLPAMIASNEKHIQKLTSFGRFPYDAIINKGKSPVGTTPVTNTQTADPNVGSSSKTETEKQLLVQQQMMAKMASEMDTLKNIINAGAGTTSQQTPTPTKTPKLPKPVVPKSFAGSKKANIDV
jgi:hypothetical protein